MRPDLALSPGHYFRGHLSCAVCEMFPGTRSNATHSSDIQFLYNVCHPLDENKPLIATSFTIFSKDRENDHENSCSAEIHWLSPGRGLKRDIEQSRDTHFYFTKFYQKWLARVYYLALIFKNKKQQKST